MGGGGAGVGFIMGGSSGRFSTLFLGTEGGRRGGGLWGGGVCGRGGGGQPGNKDYYACVQHKAYIKHCKVYKTFGCVNIPKKST